MSAAIVRSPATAPPHQAIFVTVTEPSPTSAAPASPVPTGSGTAGEQGAAVRCAWCGRRFVPSAGPGRPRRYCKRSCRQRDFEARQRISADGLAEGELVVTRQALSQIDDLVYVLACAVEDVERDLSADHDDEDVRRSLSWLLDAARPLAARSVKGSILLHP